MTETRKTWLLLFLPVLLGFLWKMYPRFLAPTPFPSDETNNLHFILWLFRNDSVAVDALYQPHMAFYLIYLASLLSGISFVSISFVFNPLVSSLSAIPFYFLMNRKLPKAEAFAATVLFVFSEAWFYRSSFFGSTESLGLFLAVSSLALFAYHKYLFAVVCYFLIPFAHVLPFVFVSLMFAVKLLQQRRFKLLGLLTIVGIAFLFNPFFSPHKRQVTLIPATSSFSLGNFFIYSLSELALNVFFFMGSITIFLLALLKWRRFQTYEKLLFISLIGGFLLAFAFYNVNVIAPFRLIPYLTFTLIPVVAREYKHQTLFAFILCLSLVSPLIGGAQQFLWYKDAITQEEINAIMFLGKEGIIRYGAFNDTMDGARYWFSDTVVEQYLKLIYGGSMHNASTDWYFYVFLSPRMMRNAFFREFPYESGFGFVAPNARTKLIHKPVLDVWASNSSWVRIFPQELGEVRVYALKGWNGH